MRKVIIMSGISGSGKSSHIQKLFDEVGEGKTFAVVSADHFFTKDGVYNFDPSKLSEAHGECFYDFITHMRHLCNLVVVDNTNTTEVEIAPYILGAQAFGYVAEILTLVRPAGMDPNDYYRACHARNSHGVSEVGVKQQYSRLLNRALPPWWKNAFIDTKF